MNIQRFSRFVFFGCWLLLLTSSCCLATTTKGLDRAPKVIRSDVYRTPDHSLLATVVFLKQRIYGDPPSRVEIRRADGRLLSGRDYSACRGQGYTVRQAGWTADGRFFVYIVDSSGGHGPWHRPLFFYDRKRNRFYSLDTALAGYEHGEEPITGDLKLQSPCTVLTKGLYFGSNKRYIRARTDPDDTSRGRLLKINLSRLEPHLGVWAEDNNGQKIFTPDKKRLGRP